MAPQPPLPSLAGLIAVPCSSHMRLHQPLSLLPHRRQRVSSGHQLHHIHCEIHHSARLRSCHHHRRRRREWHRFRHVCANVDVNAFRICFAFANLTAFATSTATSASILASQTAYLSNMGSVSSNFITNGTVCDACGNGTALNSTTIGTWMTHLR